MNNIAFYDYKLNFISVSRGSYKDPGFRTVSIEC
jgi:hypothetical protein